MFATLDGRVYIVTGASRGIGLSVARSIVKRNAKAIMIGRDTKALQEGADGIGEGAYPVIQDIRQREGMWTLFGNSFERFGRLDGLINNAGVVYPCRIETLVPEQVVEQVHANYIAQIFACQGVIPYLRQSGGGHILNVTSAGARRQEEYAHMSVYFGAKAAMERFSFELREEVKQYNISVTLFSPGSTRTSPTGWDPEEAKLSMDAWIRKGVDGDSFMEPETVGEAIVRCLETPPHCAYDIVELRPNWPAPKRLLL